MDGLYTPMFGALQPDVLRFASVPTWDEKNEVLPRDQWEEHDDLAPFFTEIEQQRNNNCTAASMACLMLSAFRAAGVEDAPRFSWGFNYALHNGGRDAGAFCRELAWDVKNGTGIMPASLWPDTKIYLSRNEPTEDQLAESRKWAGLEVYQCMNFDDVGSALTKRFHVYHGFILGSSYSGTRSDGIVPEWDGVLANGHAMWSRGLRKVGGKWRTITPNTWGRGFGQNGVGYWPESYFWAQRGNFVNLDCFAVRAVKRRGDLPVAREE